MKSFRSVFSGLIAAVLLTGMAVAQHSVSPVPDCGRAQYEDDTLIIVNPCSITVSVTYTSFGDVSGGTVIASGQSARTAYSREAVNRVGGVRVYTCPGNGTPVQPDSSPIIGHYMGLEYGCHGPDQDENGRNQLKNTLQSQPSVQQQVQQSLPAPTPILITPSASDFVVQQPDSMQQVSDDDDESSATDQENQALLQQYQQNLQNMINTMQNRSVPKVAPPPVRPCSGCDPYPWK